MVSGQARRHRKEIARQQDHLPNEMECRWFSRKGRRRRVVREFAVTVSGADRPRQHAVSTEALVKVATADRGHGIRLRPAARSRISRR